MLAHLGTLLDLVTSLPLGIFLGTSITMCRTALTGEHSGRCTEKSHDLGLMELGESIASHYKISHQNAHSLYHEAYPRFS